MTVLELTQDRSDAGNSATSRGLASFRRSILRIFAVWVVLVATTGLSQAPVNAQTSSDASSFIAAINQVRASRGLPALIQDNELAAASLTWTRAQQNGACPDVGPDETGRDISGSPEMPGTDWICHAPDLSTGVTQLWAKLGENVGTGGSVNDVMDGFIASPSHFANIVDPAFTHVGVAVVWDAAGQRLHTTHRFMELQPAPPPTTTTTASSPAPLGLAFDATPTRPAPTTVAPTTAAPTTSAPTTSDAPPTTTVPPAAQPPAVNIGSERAAVLINALSKLGG